MLKKAVPFGVAVFLALSGILGSGSTTPTPTGAQPVTQTQHYVAGTTPGDPNAFRPMGLVADVECSASGRANLLLYWEPPRRTGLSKLWVDLSANPNSFVPGTFLSRGPLNATDGMVEWDGLMPGQMHYARVNVLQGAELQYPMGGYPFWATSDTVVFTTPWC